MAHKAGCKEAVLIADAKDIDWEKTSQFGHVGLTAGASAPEEVIQEVIAAFEQRFALSVQALDGVEENVHFKLPRGLRDS